MSGQMSGGASVVSAIDLITRTTASAGQADQAVFFQQISQMAGCSSLGHLRHGLVLRGADAVFEAIFIAVEQAVESTLICSVDNERSRCCCQNRGLPRTRSIRAIACCRLRNRVFKNHASQSVISSVAFWLDSSAL